MNTIKRPAHPLLLILILAFLAALILVSIGRPAPSISNLEEIQGTVGSIWIDRSGRSAALDMVLSENPKQTYTVVPDARAFFPGILDQVHYGMHATIWASPPGLFGRRQIWQISTPGRLIVSYSSFAAAERSAWLTRIIVAILLLILEVVVFLINMRKWSQYKAFLRIPAPV